MGYEIAVNKAWDDLTKLTPEKTLSLKFLADEYTVDIGKRQVWSLSCNVPAKDFAIILILHYLSRKLEGLPRLSSVWLDFKDLAGIVSGAL